MTETDEAREKRYEELSQKFGEGAPRPSSETFKEVRAYAKRLQRELREAKAQIKDFEAGQRNAVSSELEELQAYRAEAAIVKAFKPLGLSEPHARLYYRTADPSTPITAEVVRSWAEEHYIPHAIPAPPPSEEESVNA